ncbi:hypothetical protein LVO79_21915 (plasmid) [Roseivivax marinus]|uniref:hypothetical protein n=1 Tax=Roseivivax marinus TaxID=1379903 RepID=UPI001F035CF6|nr:hypothetical protein [Roseivivax marinus]UMA67365.1 hypothetical protein LVO79_21915 [Roseivivax marinus]
MNECMEGMMSMMGSSMMGFMMLGGGLLLLLVLGVLVLSLIALVKFLRSPR